jgi:hypothetical protein
MHLITCINCGHSYHGKFCPECGQKSSVKRLSPNVLVEEFAHFFTHVEKHFLHTSKEFILHPGRISHNFLLGKRKNYQKPVSYFLIWTGIFIICHNFIIGYFNYEYVVPVNQQSPEMAASNLFLRKHFSFMMLPLLFITALVVWLVMARPRFYFFEVVVLNLYGGGTYFILNLVSDIVLGVLLQININHINVFIWQTILSALYNFWFAYDFFSRFSLRFFWLRMFLTSILIAIAGKIFMDYAPLLWLYITGQL